MRGSNIERDASEDLDRFEVASSFFRAIRPADLVSEAEILRQRCQLVIRDDAMPTVDEFVKALLAGQRPFIMALLE